MRAMRIRQVTRRINLMRLHFIDQLSYNANIFLRQRIFLHLAGLIEWPVQKMHISLGQPYETAGGPGLAPADNAFNTPYFGDIHFLGLLLLKKFTGNLILPGFNLPAIVTCYIFVPAVFTTVIISKCNIVVLGKSV